MSKHPLQFTISEIIKEEVSAYIFRNLGKNVKKRICLKCRAKFIPHGKYHQFCSRKCYGQMHRIPGFVKRIIDHED
jgi:hypothetical protein